MHVEDYAAIESVCKIFNMKVHYVDIDHFANATSKIVDGNTWAALRGKVTVIWAPNTTDRIHSVPLAELIEHVTQGGPLITGHASVFTVTAGNFKYLTAGRRVINAGNAVQLTELKTNLIINDNKIEGNHVIGFMAALLATMSPERKLKVLQQDIINHGKRTINTIKLDSYQSFATSGCCGCGNSSKVSPVIQTAFTIHDMILCSIRADLSLDIMCNLTCGLVDPKLAYKSLLSYANSQNIINNSTPQSSQLAADIYAVLSASGIILKNCPLKQPELLLLANQCHTIAVAGNQEPDGLRERVRDIDVIQGLSRRKKSGFFGNKDPIDQSYGVVAFVYKGDPKQWF